jgi:hypothetical protein
LKTKLVAIALILVFIVMVAAPAHAQTAPQNLTIKISRTASIGIWGVVHINDNFTVHNSGISPVTYLDYGVPNTYRTNLRYISSTDSLGRTMTVDTNVNQASQFYWFRIHFPTPLQPNSTYSFTVTSIVSDVIATATNGLLYNYTAAPVLTQDAAEANVTLLGSIGSSFAVAPNSTYTEARVGGFPALVKQYKPWTAYSTETFVGPYLTVSQYIIDLTSFERDVILGNGGTLSVRDTYKLHNYAIPITGMTITLPSGATNVMAYDVVGAMWTVPLSPGPPYQVTVAPRYGGEGIRGGEDYTFTLAYDLPQSEYVKQLDWWGNFNLTIPMLNNHDDFVFQNSTVKIQAPRGFQIDNFILPSVNTAASPIQYDPTHEQFTLQGVTSLSNVTLAIFYRFVPFWAGFDYLPWIFGLEIVLGAVLIVTRVRRGPEPEIPVPVERLREFVGLYDERISLSRELVAMEEEVARGGMVKHEFRRRSKVMDMRLDEINKSLMEVKAEIRVISQHYDELIRRIDRAETDIQVARSSLNQVRGQYRAGKITRETYDSVTNDLTKRIDRAEGTVETIIITLREEAR